MGVGGGGALVARDVSVDGDIQAEGADRVELTGSTVDGKIQLEGGGSSTVATTQVDGDLQWET